MNVLSTSAMGMRVLARKPPSSVCMPLMKSTIAGAEPLMAAEQLEQAGGRGRGIGAAALHGGHFHKAAVAALPRAHKVGQPRAIGHRPADQLLAQSHQKRIVRAAGRSFFGAGVTAIRRGESAPARAATASRQPAGAAANTSMPAMLLQQRGPIHQRQKIHNRHALARAAPVRNCAARWASFAVQFAQDGQSSQGKAGVVQVAWPFASAEAAIGPLGRRK